MSISIPSYPFLGAFIIERENTALSSACFRILCLAVIPVLSVTGVASIMLSKASLSPKSEHDSESESTGTGTDLAILSGGFLSSTLGFENGFDASTRRRSSAISSSSSSSSSDIANGSPTSTPPSSPSSSLLFGASESSPSSSSESNTGCRFRLPPFQASSLLAPPSSSLLSEYSRSILASQTSSAFLISSSLAHAA